jgi:hypothetical protein
VVLNTKSSKIKVADLISKYAWIVFVAAAIYHLLSIFVKLNNSTTLRNELFILINLWCAFEVKRGKKYFIILFAILFIQQVYSHGDSLLKNLNENKIDWLSVIVILTMSSIFWALLSSLNKKDEFL